MRNLTSQLFIAFFMLTLPFVAICNDDISVNFINESSFEDLQDVAFEEDKPIFITFHATWSTSCQKMRQDVFTDDKVADYMNQHFINYSANIESKIGSALAEYYNAHDLPTTIIISPTGHVIVKNTKTSNPDQFLRWAKDANNTYTNSKQHEMGKTFPSYAPVSLDDSDEPYVPQMIMPIIKEDVVLKK